MSDGSEGTRTIVVTGGAGFVGSHLVEALAADADNRIISVDDYSTGQRSNEHRLSNVEYRTAHTSTMFDIGLPNPDLVFHLAEYSRVAQSFTEPGKVWKANLAGTSTVLEFCRATGADLVYAGSSTKFADPDDNSLEGRDQSPYAWSKATNAELVKNYGHWYGLKYSITYFYNVYGPREIEAGRYSTVIGIFRRQFLSGLPRTVALPGTQKRNFTHVKDIVRGIVLASEKLDGHEYQLGNERAYTVREVAELFGPEILEVPERKGDRMDARLDVSSAAALGWKAEHSLEDYVREIVAEHRGQ